MQLTATGISLVLIKNGHPLSEEEFLSLSKDEQQKFTQKREEVKEKLTPLLRQLQTLNPKPAKNCLSLTEMLLFTPLTTLCPSF